MVIGWKNGQVPPLEPRPPLPADQGDPAQRPEDQRDDDESDHAVEQHREGHAQVARARDEEADDRREQHEHDQVVQRNLHERVGRIAVRQVRPDEDHRGAGGGGEDDRPRDVLVGQLRADERQEEVLEEHPAEEGHRERLDDPVDEERDEQSARPPADSEQAAEVDLQHHRVDHQPDQDRDRDVDLAPLAELETAKRVRRTREELSQKRLPRPCRPRPRA